MLKRSPAGILPAIVFCSVAALGSPAALAQNNLEDVVTGVARTLLNQELDRNAYAEAQRKNTVAAYQQYLSQFPQGAYRGNATQQLQKLGASATPAKPGTSTPATTPTLTASQQAIRAEAALGLSRSQRITIQQQLNALGYDVGGADGLWGSKTRSGIVRWQKANDQPQTGYVTQSQVTRIAAQAKNRTPQTPSQPAVQSDAALEESLLQLSKGEKREVQLRLTLLGYNTQGTDGVFGRNTRAAIARWQGDHAWKDSGYLTADQVRELSRESGG